MEIWQTIVLIAGALVLYGMTRYALWKWMQAENRADDQEVISCR